MSRAFSPDPDKPTTGTPTSTAHGKVRPGCPKPLSPWPGLPGCSLCASCPYLGHGRLQHDVPDGQRRRVQHGHHHHQHVRAARRALPGKVQQDPEPVLVVGCHGQGTACHRETRESIHVRAAAHGLRQHQVIRMFSWSCSSLLSIS